jgi:DNA replication protein DnaC
VTAAPEQVGDVLEQDDRPRHVKPALKRDGDEWVVTVSCPRCRQPTEHRLAVAEHPEEPSERALKLSCIILCSGCTVADDAAGLQKRTAEARSARVSAADIPPSLVGLKFKDMLDGAAERRRQAIEIVRQWSAMTTPAARPGLYIYGSVGVGKTRLAATGAWARLEHAPIRWVSVAVLMAKLSAAWGDADRRQALQVLTGHGAVVLDDIDKVNPSENARAQLYAAINERIDAKAPMIVTANSKLSELAARLGDPIVSRLAGHCTQLELDGPDRRLSLIPGGS